MLEKIKNIGWTGLGLIFMVFMVLVFAFFVKGGVWLFANFNELFQTINGWVFALVLFLILLSAIPKIRIYTGLSIYYLTYVWGAIFWLFCLFVTYQFWGFLGIFIGLIMAGVGVFLTAFLAILFSGQISGALMIALNLAIIYGVRSLGYWIASKHKNIIEVENKDIGSVDTGEVVQVENSSN